jgi:uncharacterized protein
VKLYFTFYPFLAKTAIMIETNASPYTCWVVTDGKIGMENQARGLAEAMGITPVVKRIRLRTPWRQLTPYFRLGHRFAFSGKGDPIKPPWPDILIATGRSSIPASLHVRRESLRHGGKGTFVVQLQDPVIHPDHFDLVVVPRHDELLGKNVMTTRGGLHRVTPQKLMHEAKKFEAAFAHLPHPRITVVLGGNNAVYKMTPHEMLQISSQLTALLRETGGSLLVTPSRRTGDMNMAVLSLALTDMPAYIWDGKGENPYYAMLAAADAILVTCDSVNLVSEAATTGKPVMVIDLPGGSEKFQRFHQALRDDGLTRSFNGRLESWHYQPLDDVARVAHRILSLVAAR